MTYDKKQRAQPSKKRRHQKELERMPQRRESPDQPAKPSQPDQRGVRRRPGEGLDKSDEGVIAGGRLAGRRFTG